jgi:hypothetical protein
MFHSTFSPTPEMAVALETANFESLLLRCSGKFENICFPILTTSASLPYGVELESRFSPLPVFAGGTDPRKHLTVQLELSEDNAESLRRLDAACEAASTASGTWSPLVNIREGRVFVKARLMAETANLRIEGANIPAGWDSLGPALLEHRMLRGADAKVALRASYIWSVSGKRGITLVIEQLVAQPRARNATLDYFA